MGGLHLTDRRHGEKLAARLVSVREVIALLEEKLKKARTEENTVRKELKALGGPDWIRNYVMPTTLEKIEKELPNLRAEELKHLLDEIAQRLESIEKEMEKLRETRGRRSIVGILDASGASDADFGEAKKIWRCS